MADNYIRPTSSQDPDGVWTDHEKAYDTDLETYAYTATIDKYLLLILTDGILCEKVKFALSTVGGGEQNPEIELDVYYGSAWHNIFTGVADTSDWLIKTIGSSETVTKARIKYTNDIYTSFNLHDFLFNSILPTVTVQAPTDILTTTATANGNIILKGTSDVTTRGFNYGLTKVATWSEWEDGNFEIGEFSLPLTGLTANTTYWIQAAALNGTDVGYSEWIEFQTSAAGSTPTGTMKSICSDYSGYTFILNESLTDNGDSYESYFVISTDLADKQGLHIKKRLLDLYSYFEKKDSGTCKIYVKRDNETTWQYCGQILMTGDEDIIVKHLPSENQDTSGDVDFLAKHYLIKFVFENDFEFIGLITEFVPIGVR